MFDTSTLRHFKISNPKYVFLVLKLNVNDTNSNRYGQNAVATMFQRLGGKFSYRPKQITAFALLFNTITWYFIGRLMITKMSEGFPNGSFETLCLQLTYPSAIIISAIVGSIFLIRVPRVRFFWGWMLIGVFTSLCTAIPTESSLSASLAVAVALGASMGIGTTICFSYFAESISIGNRGKVAGCVLFTTLVSSLFAQAIIPLSSMAFGATLLSIWRIWGLPFLLLVPRGKPTVIDDTKTPALSAVVHNKTFYMYFIAWLMFAFVDSLGGVILAPITKGLSLQIRLIEPLATSFSAIIAGTLSDWIGRKRVLIFGFVSLGIAYAILGLFSGVLVSLLFYFVADGIALGSLWVLFVMVLWGDLTSSGSERFYAVGETPFFLTGIFSLILTPYVSLIPQNSSFSLAAFFLFISVLPLLYAPETLPEKNIKNRELEQYVKKAKRIKEKHT